MCISFYFSVRDISDYKRQVVISVTLAIPGGHRTLHVSRSVTSQLRHLRASRDINITSTYIVIYVLHVRYVRTRGPICFSEIDMALKKRLESGLKLPSERRQAY